MKVGIDDEAFIKAHNGGRTRGYSLVSDAEVPRYDLAHYAADASPKVVIFSAYNAKYAPLAAIAAPNWEAYAKKHGYGLRLYPDGFHLNPDDLSTYGDKGKFQWYYELCGGADIVMFLDIDALFMNMEWNIESLLGSQQPFFWTYGDDGPLSGLWIARTDELTQKHLRFAYEYAAANNNVRHGTIEPNGISDQDAMTRLMNTPPFGRTFNACYDAREFGHCFESNYYPESWLITFPGMSPEEKLAKMKEWSNRAG